MRRIRPIGPIFTAPDRHISGLSAAQFTEALLSRRRLSSHFRQGRGTSYFRFPQTCAKLCTMNLPITGGCLCGAVQRLPGSVLIWNFWD